MGMPLKEAQQVAEKLNKFDPSLNAKVKEPDGETHVLGTTGKLRLNGSRLRDLADIVHGWSVTVKRSGANVRIVVW